MSENTYDKLDQSILETIDACREEFNACTARWVAGHLRLSADVTRHRLLKMQKEGLVEWNEMPGSLVTRPSTDESVEDEPSASSGTEPPEPVVPESVPDQPESTAPPASSKKAAPKKKAAAKKGAAPAKKAAAPPT